MSDQGALPAGPGASEVGRAASRRRWAVVVVTVALIGLVGAALVWSARPRTGGPLSSGDSGAIVNAFPAGSTVTFGLQTLGNGSPSEEIQIVSVAVRIGEPSVEVLGEPELLGPDRVEAMDAGMFDVLAGWPPDGAPTPIPVAGTTIAPDAYPYEVIVPLRVPSVAERIGIIEGFVVEYTVNGRRYRDVTNTVLVICPIEYYTACDAFDPNTDL